MRSSLGCLVAAGVLVLAAGARAEGIYTCTDAKGRRLTSDRPIIDCIDREQTMLGPTGQVLRKIGPSLTAEERAAEEERSRRAAEERSRALEQKKRDRALLGRYPDKAAHDKERNQALAAVDDVIRTAMARIEELRAERRKIDTELEFYRGDAAKAPAQLRRRLEENDEQAAAQQRFIANQDDEKKRINAKYEEELLRLHALWAQRVTPTAAAAPSRSSSSAAR